MKAPPVSKAKNPAPPAQMFWMIPGAPGGGYWYDVEKLVGDPTFGPASGANPYDGVGRLAAISEVCPPDMRVRVVLALWEATAPNSAEDHTNASRVLELNSQADPIWTGALSRVCAGASVAEAWAGSQKGVGGNYLAPEFTEAQLEAAKVVMDGYR